MHPYYSPLDPVVTDDPYPAYKVLRDEAPVYHNERDDFWALSRHEDISIALLDPVRFSVRRGVTFDDTDRDDIGLPVLSVFDPPEHTRLRGFMAAAFLPSSVQRFEESFTANIATALEQCRGRDHLDLVQDLLFPFAVENSLDLLEIDAADRERWRGWMGTYLERERGCIGFTPAGDEAIVAAVDHLAKEHVSRLRDRSGTFLSNIVNARVDGDRMTDDEVLGLLVMMAIVGAEDVTRTVAFALRNLAADPAQLAMVRDEPELVGPAVDETIRRDASTQYMRRTTNEEVVVHGVAIPADARVLLLFGAGNRQPGLFTDPDAFLVSRPNSRRAMGFSQGAHSCLGIHVARLQMQLGVAAVLDAWIDYEVDESRGLLVHAQNVSGFQELPARVAWREQ